jgi:hypothetical protein
MTVLGIGFIIIKAALSNFREAGARTLYFSLQGFLGGVSFAVPKSKSSLSSENDSIVGAILL